MFTNLSRRLTLSLMKSRAERHSGCRIDVERLRNDPEYASAIRTLAQFTLDEELSALGAIPMGMVERHVPPPPPLATVLPFRRHAPH
jgi:hypothetical protein